jgi:Zn-dependent metalloprotease
LVLALGVSHSESKAGAAPATSLRLPEGARIATDPLRGTVRSLSGSNLSAELERDAAFRTLQAEQPDGSVALAFLKSIAPLLKLLDIPSELREIGSTRDNIGMAHVSFAQTYQGVSVWGCQVRVHLDRSRHVTGLEASIIPTPTEISLATGITDAQALALTARLIEMPDCGRCKIEKVIWPGDADRSARLAYALWVPKTLREKWQILMDAQSGALLEKHPATADSRR